MSRVTAGNRGGGTLWIACAAPRQRIEHDLEVDRPLFEPERARDPGVDLTDPPDRRVPAVDGDRGARPRVQQAVAHRHETRRRDAQAAQQLDGDLLAVVEIDGRAGPQPVRPPPDQDRGRVRRLVRRLLGVGRAPDDRADLEQTDVRDAARDVAARGVEQRRQQRGAHHLVVGGDRVLHDDTLGQRARPAAPARRAARTPSSRSRRGPARRAGRGRDRRTPAGWARARRSSAAGARARGHSRPGA